MTTKTPKATHHVVFIVAEVHGPEVADMLRYENAVPANEDEANKMARAIRSGRNSRIIFRRFVTLGAPVDPTVGRWKSFNMLCHPQAFSTFVDAEKFVSSLPPA
jgi:hypothetical protein